MQKKDILIQAWDYCYDIEGWYPPLKNALEDVDGSQAIWRPEGETSNTIREIVNHYLRENSFGPQRAFMKSQSCPKYLHYTITFDYTPPIKLSS